jgi:hypothetical protein
MRRVLSVIGVAAVFGALVQPAFGAVRVGDTFTPPSRDLPPYRACADKATFLQAEYSVPAEGVITRWYFQANSDEPKLQPLLRFKVGRLVSGTTYSIVGESGVVKPVPASNTHSGLNEYAVRIPVRAGDLVGFYTVTPGPCFRDAPGMNMLGFSFKEVALGTQAESFGTYPLQVDVAASVERDADHDGFGDASQDQCPTNGATHGPCKCRKHSKKHLSGAVIAKKCEKKHHR